MLFSDPKSVVLTPSIGIFAHKIGCFHAGIVKFYHKTVDFVPQKGDF